MSALDTLERIVNNEYLVSHPFKYCLVASDKLPYTIKNTLAKPNCADDFCSLEEIASSTLLTHYEGIGISIVESKVSAIDIDKCFSIPFDVNSGDDRAKFALELFKDKAYVEFSFSGKGLRILFIVDNIEDYTQKYYIKNDKTKIEYYQPGNTARYVTITGKTIYNNDLHTMSNLDTILLFLNKYMVRPVIVRNERVSSDFKDDRSMEEIMKKVKSLYMRDIEFQNLWFETEHEEHLLSHIQGRSRESTADYHLLLLIYDKITQDKEKLRLVFEASPYFKSKDAKHVYKWNYNNHRYFEYMWERL